MNDFTKEELQELRASRCYHLDDSFPATDKLFMKIESMIDNYCDHEWDNSCCQCPIESIYCEKCDKRLKNDNQ